MAPPTLTQTTPDRRAAVRRPYRRQRRPEERVRLLGEAVDLVRPEEVLHHVQAAVAEGRKTLIANHNLHSLHLIQTQAEMRVFYDRADLIQVDSTPLIWFLRALGLPGRGFHRSTYLDWRDHFWSVADRRGWRVMSIGGAPAVGPEAARRLAERYPQLFGPEPVPLKRGIFQDLLQAHAGEWDAAELKQALSRHTRSGPYLNAVAAGRPAEGDELLPPETDAAVAAVAGDRHRIDFWQPLVGPRHGTCYSHELSRRRPACSQVRFRIRPQ